MDSQKCLGETEKQSSLCAVLVRLPSMFFKLEYLKTASMLAERYFRI